mmetsp:Transcript_5632/g.9251  ORF Transcript_5632/g.9251 Transcript_5632/m.9251 type:complete len:81 (-) Transcript_5632:790-1032(-)
MSSKKLEAQQIQSIRVSKNICANVMLHLVKAPVYAINFKLHLGVINIELLKEVMAVATSFGCVPTANKKLGSSTVTIDTL